jgi:hypothetical protein
METESALSLPRDIWEGADAPPGPLRSFRALDRREAEGEATAAAEPCATEEATAEEVRPSMTGEAGLDRFQREFEKRRAARHAGFSFCQG